MPLRLHSFWRLWERTVFLPLPAFRGYRHSSTHSPFSVFKVSDGGLILPHVASLWLSLLPLVRTLVIPLGHPDNPGESPYFTVSWSATLTLSSDLDFPLSRNITYSHTLEIRMWASLEAIIQPFSRPQKWIQTLGLGRLLGMFGPVMSQTPKFPSQHSQRVLVKSLLEYIQRRHTHYQMPILQLSGHS